MSKTMIDIPDDFKNELIFIAARGGSTIRLQILAALQKAWGWDESRLPLDGRYKSFPGAGERRPVMTNGQTPHGTMPLGKDGIVDLEAAFQRADEAMKASIEPDKEF